MATTTATSIKLVIDGKTQRVLFADASKEVVDFLFSLLAMPVSLVGRHAMVGCVGNLYASSSRLRVQAGLPVNPPVTLYRCATGSNHNYNISCRNYVTHLYGKACPNCHCLMTTAVNCVSAPGAGTGSSSSGQDQVVVPKGTAAARGLGQGVATYTVLDDLTVMPSSSINVVNLLSTCGVELGDLQQKLVPLGHNEGMAILKASLQSKTVLTDVCLHGKN